MYQPSPSAGQAPEPVHPGPPASVVNAVRLMYAGAVVSAVSLVLFLVTAGSLRASLHKAAPTLTSAQLHTAQTGLVIASVVFELISIGLWILMARMNRAGRSGARIVASVLFGLNTLLLLFGLISAGAAGGILVTILIWLIGLGAIVMLWRRESTEYFTAMSAPQAR